MPYTSTPGRTYPVELDRAECLRLLESVDLGRVIYTERAMPAAYPVRYALDGEEIFFRTDNLVMLAAAAKGAVSAIQVDQIDPQTPWVGPPSESAAPARSPSPESWPS